LYHRSPGFAVSQYEKLYLHNEPDSSNNVREQHLPPGALAIIQGNRDELERVAQDVVREEPEIKDDVLDDLYRNVGILAYFSLLI
jgi:hypothetical protein